MRVVLFDLDDTLFDHQHCSRAGLVAPRAFLDLSGLNDGHGPTQRQRLLMLMKIMEVYELEDAAKNFGFYVHGRGHSVAHESRQLIYGFMDSHLKSPEATRTRLVSPSTK